jgi:hypothetical protein
MKLALQIVLLIVLPYGSAILLGFLGERFGGKTGSGLASVAGLFLGIYFLRRALGILFVS